MQEGGKQQKTSVVSQLVDQPQQTNLEQPGQLNPEKQKLIQEHLRLLVHAKNCQPADNNNPINQRTEKCNEIHCDEMKDVLHHMEKCQIDKDCPVTHCSMSRRILSHWKNCYRTDCPVSLTANYNCNASMQVDKIKIIQQHMVLLMHAYKCQKRQNEHSNTIDCTVRHCKTLTEVLSHMANCKMEKDCLVDHCSTSRTLISHWKSCIRAECPICLPMRRPYTVNSSNTQSNIFSCASIINWQSDRQHSNQFSATTQPLAQWTSDAGNGFVGPRLLTDRILPAHLYYAQPSNIPDINDWRSSITSEIRNQLVHKFVQSILPSYDPQAVPDYSMHNLLTHAQKVERNNYENANSRSEYYRSWAGNIYQIQMELNQIQSNRTMEQN